MTATILEPPFRLDEVPERAAVFVIHLGAGRPYVARTTMLRRRLKRLLEPGEGRRLRLGGLAQRVEYVLTGSKLAASLLYYELSKQHFGDDYASMLRLRPSPWVKVLLGNEFPRTSVTTRVSGGSGYLYGPFRTRAAAERFEQEALDLFQVRRCQEDLAVSPEHPGCIYGEMMKCLRPCQEVVGPAEYATEVRRLVEFLDTGGGSLLESVGAARARCSENLDFEEAARQHARYQKIEGVLKLRDELVTGLDDLCGVAVAPSVEEGSVELLILLRGCWLEPVQFRVAATGGEPVSMDRRLRELFEGESAPKLAAKTRGEHVALLARWFYSSWRDGEWIPFARREEPPYRRLVRAISKVASGAC